VTTRRAPSTKALQKWDFQLYVAGGKPRSLAAYKNLKRVCEEYLAGRYEITVIDLLKHPERAREADIAALPTLVRNLPPPMRRIIGDLSRTPELLHTLGYTPGGDE